MKKIGIYVHIPFCKSKCKYCNFTSYVGCENLMDDYLKSIVNEIVTRKSSDVEIDTIYIGGGTPSFMPNGTIATILNAIKTNYNVLPDCEISVECNPNSIDYAKAQEWFDSGVNRVSIGLQSVKQSLLNVMGRTHTKMDFVKAVECLQAVGFKNINVDMMIGIPKQKLSDVRQTIYAIEKLGITHISCYSLILENNTPMHSMVQAGALREPNEDKTINMYSYVYKYLDRIGYKRYEVSNFAIPGYECKHNMNTWHLHEYMGIGVSAHGYLNGHRYANTTSLDKYIKDVSSTGTSIEYSEEETSYDLIEEYIMLGLRLNEGIDLKYLKDTYSYDLLEYKKNEIKKLKDLGLIEILDNRLFATNNGFYVLNAIIIELV